MQVNKNTPEINCFCLLSRFLSFSVSSFVIILVPTAFVVEPVPCQLFPSLLLTNSPPWALVLIDHVVVSCLQVWRRQRLTPKARIVVDEVVERWGIACILDSGAARLTLQQHPGDLAPQDHLQLLHVQDAQVLVTIKVWVVGAEGRLDLDSLHLPFNILLTTFSLMFSLTCVVMCCIKQSFTLFFLSTLCLILFTVLYSLLISIVLRRGEL